MSQMEYAGNISSEETWTGDLGDGRLIFTQAMGTMYRMSQDEALNPQKWLEMWMAGKFADPENCPDVWVVDAEGEKHYYPPNKREAINAYKAEQRAFWAARANNPRPAREGRPARAPRH